MSVVMDEAQQLTLVRQACNGHDRAAEDLIGHFRPRILRYCLSRLGRVEVAEDVTQETCLALVDALPRFEPQGHPLSSFVFGIASNKVAMARRSMARSREVDDAALVDVPSAATGPEQAAVLADEVSRLVGPLQELSDVQREVLLLRVVAQLSAEEVGATLSMTPGAVRVCQHRAMQRLRRSLTAGGGTDD